MKEGCDIATATALGGANGTPDEGTGRPHRVEDNREPSDKLHH